MACNENENTDQNPDDSDQETDMRRETLLAWEGDAALTLQYDTEGFTVHGVLTRTRDPDEFRFLAHNMVLLIHTTDFIDFGWKSGELATIIMTVDDI